MMPLRNIGDDAHPYLGQLGATLPELQKCLLLIDTDEGFMTLLFLYEQFVSICVRVHHEGEEVSEQDLEPERSVWENQLADVYNIDGIEVFPSFADVFYELIDRGVEAPCHCGHCPVVFRGTRMFHSVATALELVCLADIERRHVERIRQLVDCQPRISHRTLDLYPANQARSEGDEYLFLTKGLEPFLGNKAEFKIAFHFMAWAVSATVEIFERTSYNPSEADIEDAGWDIYRHLSMRISDPLSEMSIEFRSKMKDANYRGFYTHLCSDASAFVHAATVPRQFLGWYLWRKIVVATCNSPALNEHRSFVLSALRSDEHSILMDPSCAELDVDALLSDDCPPQANFFSESHVNWRNSLRHRLSRNTTMADLVPQDVEFVPTEGSELDPRNYGTVLHTETDCDCGICLDKLSREEAITFPCQHSFHVSCSSDLINGISEFSNKCPQCRTVICPPRPRRPLI